MCVLINKRIGRNLERNNGNDIMNKKKILIVGNERKQQKNVWNSL